MLLQGLFIRFISVRLKKLNTTAPSLSLHQIISYLSTKMEPIKNALKQDAPEDKMNYSPLEG